MSFKSLFAHLVKLTKMKLWLEYQTVSFDHVTTLRRELGEGQSNTRWRSLYPARSYLLDGSALAGGDKG